MKTDGIYRYRLEDPPPKRAEKWWPGGGVDWRSAASGVLAFILVSALRRWDLDFWVWLPRILIAAILVRLLVYILWPRWEWRR